jgi:hypothetical protein
MKNNEYEFKYNYIKKLLNIHNYKKNKKKGINKNNLNI